MIIPQLENILITAGEETYFHSVDTENRLKMIMPEILKSGLIDKEFEDILLTCARYHDIGKSLLSKEILYKKNKLTKEEFEHIKTHSQNGYEILMSLKGKVPDQYLIPMSETALLHHKSSDGKGYPDITIDSIPEYIQLVSFADILSALNTKRSYHEKLSIEKTVDLILRDLKDKFSDNIIRLIEKCEFREAETPTQNLQDFVR